MQTNLSLYFNHRGISPPKQQLLDLLLDYLTLT